MADALMADALMDDLLNVDEFLELAEVKKAKRCELIRGRVVMLAPAREAHAAVVVNLAGLFRESVRKAGFACKVYASELGIRIDDSRSFLEPDVSVVCDKNSIVDGWCVAGPELVAEVLSSDSGYRDFVEKRGLYQKLGVKEYWIVSVEEKWVFVENFLTGVMERIEASGVVHSAKFGDFALGDIFEDVWED
jgi:Uma2 family endonuclease